ncbi:MAG: hypothetical protein Q7I99_04585, partial [Acholeplasmataceae bacterium]|nr:hypothetical protein [Acholeplasmataceae bacterium]
MKKPGEILGQAPSKIKEMIKNQIYRLDDIGMENSFVFIFDELNLVLKVTHNKDDYLKEIQMMKWLKDKVEVPNIIEYDNNKNY